MFVTIKDAQSDRTRDMHADEFRDAIVATSPEDVVAIVDAQAQGRAERYNVGRWLSEEGPLISVWVAGTKYYFSALTTDIKGRVGRNNPNVGNRFEFHCDQSGVYNVKPYMSFEIPQSPAEVAQVSWMKLHIDHYDRRNVLVRSTEVGHIHHEVIVGGGGGIPYIRGGGMGSPDEIEMACDDYLVMYWTFASIANITEFTTLNMRLAVNRVNDYETQTEACDGN